MVESADKSSGFMLMLGASLAIGAAIYYNIARDTSQQDEKKEAESEK